MGMIKALIILIAAAAANADPNRLKALLQGHRKADPDFQRHAALRVDPQQDLRQDVCAMQQRL